MGYAYQKASSSVLAGLLPGWAFQPFCLAALASCLARCGWRGVMGLGGMRVERVSLSLSGQPNRFAALACQGLCGGIPNYA